DLAGEPLEGDRGSVPVLLGVLLPLGPDLVVAFADRDLAILDLLLEAGIVGEPLLADTGQLGDPDLGVAERAHRARLHAAVVHCPFAHADLAETDFSIF